MGSLLVFFQLQLERITAKPQVHAPGPRKPSLAEQDLLKKA